VFLLFLHALDLFVLSTSSAGDEAEFFVELSEAKAAFFFIKHHKSASIFFIYGK
jgi:hypothetical protein